MLTRKTISKEELIRDVAKIRFILIIYTVLYLGSVIFFMIHPDYSLNNYIDQNYLMTMMISTWVITGYLVWYNWTYVPVKKSTKTNDMLMMIFLGVIGMWLWLPNKREIDTMDFKPSIKTENES